MSGRYDWYVRKADTLEGPFRARAIGEMAKSGEITPETQLGFADPGVTPTNWHLAKNINGLRFQPSQPPEPQTLSIKSDPASILRRSEKAGWQSKLFRPPGVIYLCAGIVFVVLMIVILVASQGDEDGGAKATPQEAVPNADEVYTRVCAFVDDYLLSPSSADYLAGGVKPAPSNGQSETYGWWVDGKVDSQNTFGVVVRSKFSSYVEFDAQTGDWEFEYLDIDGEWVYQSPKLQEATYNLMIEMEVVEKSRPRSDQITQRECGFDGDKLFAWNYARREAVNYAGERAPVKPDRVWKEEDTPGGPAWFFEFQVEREHPQHGWHSKIVEMEVHLVNGTAWASKKDVSLWKKISGPSGKPMRGPDRNCP